MRDSTFKVTDDLLASQSTRLANYILDLIVQYALMFGLVIAIAFISSLFDSYWFTDWIDSWTGFDEYLIGIVMILVYYFICEALFARTVAKVLTKTIVVRSDGTRPESMAILKRTFSRLIPFNHFSFLASPSRGWHDSLSKTYVVRKAELDQRMELHYAMEEIGQSTT
ncbi:MAG: RDD family protein [Flavobacterium sp.]|nr:RDD family protein [Flavobacterium sp.]